MILLLNRFLNSTAFIKGPDVKLFEEELQEYMGVKHVISCANGTDALQIAMMALGLKPGDEVITTNFTFIATVEVVALLGLKLVLVDPDPGTLISQLKQSEKPSLQGQKLLFLFIFLANVLIWKVLWNLQGNIIFL